MPRSSLSKGQWFLISAVIVSGAFLAISGLFRGYYEIDTSKIVQYSEDFHFKNIKEQFDNIVKMSDCNPAQPNYMASNLKEFVSFAEQSMVERGYLLVINYTIVDCPAKIVRRGILLASENAVLYEDIKPEDVIPNFR